MRDLKHLIYFENLLQEANNDLVKQAKSDGKLALGYTCYFMPEVLLDLPGCFSVRLRAPAAHPLIWRPIICLPAPVTTAAAFLSVPWRAASISWMPSWLPRPAP